MTYRIPGIKVLQDPGFLPCRAGRRATPDVDRLGDALVVGGRQPKQPDPPTAAVQHRRRHFDIDHADEALAPCCKATSRDADRISARLQKPDFPPGGAGCEVSADLPYI